MEEERPSKSARKRHSDELQALGEALIELPQAELDELPLPENLREAVMLARRITKHGGLYRQKQYIGKLMRKIDAEPIRAALDARRERERAAARRFHRIEQWRNRMVAEGEAAIDGFLAERRPTVDVAVDAAVDGAEGATDGSVDRALLVHLVERARHEAATGRPPAAARELFRVLSEAAD